MMKLTGCLLIIAVVACLVLGQAYVVEYLWNEIVADALSAPHVSFKVVLAISILISILFGNGSRSK